MTLPLASGSPDFAAAIAALLAIGLVAQWGAWQLRIPSILLLLGFGFAAGPERLGLIDPSALLGDHFLPVVSLCVGVILFEGGLSLKISELGEHSRVVWMLVTAGALVTWVLGAAFAHLILGLDAGMATLLGAVLIVSGPTVVGPLLHHIKPLGATSAILKWEGITIDPVGAVAALLVFEGLEIGTVGGAATLALGGIWNTILAGTILGIAGAALIWFVLRKYWIPDALHVPLSLTVVVLSFTAANAFQHESGLLAVTLLGAILANQKSVDIGHILEFKENLRTLLISTLFLLLAANLTNAELAQIDGQAVLFLLALIFLVRPATVWVSTWRSSLTTKERIFLAWLCPRGIVAAAVASVFALQLLSLYPSADAAQAAGVQKLVPITFFVIIGTVVVYGLTAPLVARRLGLSIPNPQGIIFIGAQEWTCSMAAALHDLDVPVLMVDTNRHNIQRARSLGLQAHSGNAIQEHMTEQIDLPGIGRVIAATPNDSVNRLVMLKFTHEFGRRGVYRLRSPGQQESKGANRRGRVLFGQDGTDYATLDDRVRRGDRIQLIHLATHADREAFQTGTDPDTLVLFVVDSDGKVQVHSEDGAVEPKVGDRVIALVPAESA